MPPERLHWSHLYEEVVTSGLCTGCAGCVIACPHSVLGYDDTYHPFHLEDEGGVSGCIHGDKGCTLCTRACPRFRDWETEADSHLWGRSRGSDEVVGVVDEILLARALSPEILDAGQDGGLVSAILIWCLEKDEIDGALVSKLAGDGATWNPEPTFASTPEEILAAAGSRYTYSANTLAYTAALEAGAEKLAMVGMSCQASVLPMMQTRGVRKVARRFSLNIGLLCSKTFDDRIFDELIGRQYGIQRESIAKMNIKGKFQLWLDEGGYEEVPLKECQPFTREGCKSCPDFAAQHADISTGGLGQAGGWTLTLVRTPRGRDIIDRMNSDGAIEIRPGSDDPGAITLMERLGAKQRERWPDKEAAPATLPPG